MNTLSRELAPIVVTPDFFLDAKLQDVTGFGLKPDDVAELLSVTGRHDLEPDGLVFLLGTGDPYDTQQNRVYDGSRLTYPPNVINLSREYPDHTVVPLSMPREQEISEASLASQATTSLLSSVTKEGRRRANLQRIAVAGGIVACAVLVDALDGSLQWEVPAASGTGATAAVAALALINSVRGQRTLRKAYEGSRALSPIVLRRGLDLATVRALTATAL